MRSLTKILFSWSTDTCWGMVRNGNIISSRDMHSFPLFWSGLSCFCVAFCFLFICLLFVSFVLSVSYASGLFVPNLPFCFLYHLYRFISTYSIRSYHHYNLKVRLSLLAKPTRYIFVIYTGRIFLDTQVSLNWNIVGRGVNMLKESNISEWNYIFISGQVT